MISQREVVTFQSFFHGSTMFDGNEVWFSLILFVPCKKRSLTSVGLPCEVPVGAPKRRRRVPCCAQKDHHVRDEIKWEKPIRSGRGAATSEHSNTRPIALVGGATFLSAAPFSCPALPSPLLSSGQSHSSCCAVLCCAVLCCDGGGLC